MSGLIKCTDRPEMNENISTINRVLKRNSQRNGYFFMDNDNVTASNLRRDGLHLNASGTRQVADNLQDCAKAHFHNGHQKIYRPVGQHLSYAQAVQYIPVVTSRM